MKKIEELIRKKRKGEQFKGNEKWLSSLSARALTETEENVLKRGLNFAVTPEKVPQEDFIVAT